MLKSTESSGMYFVRKLLSEKGWFIEVSKVVEQGQGDGDDVQEAVRGTKSLDYNQGGQF